jgi:hypothetical protein
MTIQYAESVIYSFLITHQLVSLGLILVLALLLWRKPAVFFKGALVVLVMIGILYIFTMLSGPGENGPRYNKGVPHEKQLEEVK